MMKSFKIGEQAIGGVIQVNSRPRGVYQVKCIDHYTKQVVAWRFVYGLDELESYLEEVSTPYWADKMMTYITTNNKWKTILNEK
jgi:hypothetical protein